ncbi:MAG TPA: hypothetical protein VF337_00540 [Candidatus Limnocylindrales bacterium]
MDAMPDLYELDALPVRPNRRRWRVSAGLGLLGLSAILAFCTLTLRGADSSVFEENWLFFAQIVCGLYAFASLCLGVLTLALRDDSITAWGAVAFTGFVTWSSLQSAGPLGVTGLSAFVCALVLISILKSRGTQLVGGDWAISLRRR